MGVNCRTFQKSKAYREIKRLTQQSSFRLTAKEVVFPAPKITVTFNETKPCRS